MPTMIVTLKGGFRYSNRQMVAGELFEASPRDAKILAAIGKAREAPTQARRTAEPRPPQAAAAAATPPSQPPPAAPRMPSDPMLQRNRYNRRDQRSEE